MMYKLELNLHLYFVPPMDAHGGAIVLTRTVELPFVPSAEISIYSRTFDEVGSEPLGFHLEDVIWDIDRQAFLAHTIVVSHDTPWPYIIGDVRNWIERGWRLGSYKDPYHEKWDEQEKSPPALKMTRRSKNWPDEDVMEIWPALPPQSRPKHFNKTFGVITRILAETRNADSVAYAMHQTQMYFTEEQLKGEKSPAKERFRKARDEFYKKSYTTQARRIDRIVTKYPSIKDALKFV